MKCLVTGYKGFIGKNLVSLLKEEGHTVIGLEINDVKGFEKSSNCDRAIEACDIIFHQGAITDTTCNDANHMFYYNYLFTKYLVGQAIFHQKKMVFASSASIYGVDGYPTSIYAWSKKCAEDYGTQKLGDSFVALRYFNVYGPGEEHKGKMSSIAFQAYGKKKFKLFPKEPKRDFVYVKDVVRANLAAVGAMGGVYDVGTGRSRKFEDVLNLLGINYTYWGEEKIPGWYQFYTKASKGRMLPNWKARFDLEEGIDRYLEYLKSPQVSLSE
jgi:ADP-L-glycero-D-manno-heptose 6-epimerase